MARVLEPEVMDDPERAAAYAAADFGGVNQGFVDAFLAGCPRPRRVLDLGCGPADICVRAARALPGAEVIGVDASAAMLALGRRASASAGVAGRVTLVEGRIPGLELPDKAFDALLSNSLAHHLPDPADLWREIARLAAPGAWVHVMDLLRPATPAEARKIVSAAAAGESPLLREDFYNSLLAACTLEEVRAQLDAAGLRGLGPVRSSERHWLVSGRLG